MRAVSPYRRFNLRRNPFGELSREERAELAVIDMDRWRTALRTPDSALQFIAPCGHGKTTHLLGLQRWLTGAVYVLLPEVGRHPEIPATRPLLLDEAQRLSAQERRQVLRGRGPLVLGTHEDLATHLTGAGFQVTTVELAEMATPERLCEMLTQRIAASRAGDGAVPRISRKFALTLLREFGPDVRRIEQHLYAQFQHAVQRGATWPPVT